jgi:hypothetical protein
LFFWSWEDIDSPGDAAHCLWSFVAQPSYVHIAERLRGRCPEEVAGAMVEESHQFMGMPIPHVDRLEAAVDRSFKQALEAGTYDGPLRAGGASLTGSRRHP